MAGAPCLCGEAALRSGAGLVTIAVPLGLYPIVAARVAASCMTHPLPDLSAEVRCCGTKAEGAGGGLSDSGIDEVIEYAGRFDVIALGPGIGRAPETARLVHALVSKVERPMVVDADGLNALSENAGVLRAARAKRILTPHPGEMARLAALKSAGEVQQNRLGIASEFALKFGVVVALKGYNTVVTDGERYYENNTGNPGMATGGTGDVLTGVVAALVAQGLEAFEAAQLGVYLHGLAGDLGAERLGEVSLIASDLLDELPRAFQQRQTHRRGAEDAENG
jgi:NAD(P)H-hydrate epimerase